MFSALIRKEVLHSILSLRYALAFILVLVALVGVIGGATEISLHGFSFFLFRNAGAGAGNSQNLEEDQGPGQSDAPGAQHHGNVSKPSVKPTSKASP